MRIGRVRKAIIRKFYGRLPAAALARELRCSTRQIYLVAFRAGLTHSVKVWSPTVEQVLREKHSAGWTDTEIAPAVGVSRSQVSEWRRRIGLPSNRSDEHVREKIRQKTLEQCRAAGVANLGALRARVLAERSADMGWPAHLPWRAAQILTALWENGPMTRRQIVEAIRPDLIGQCARIRMNTALHDNARYGGGDNQNSYLANLLKRGLIVDLGPIVKSGRRGVHPHVYSLPLTLQRGPVRRPEEGTYEQAAG